MASLDINMETGAPSAAPSQPMMDDQGVLQNQEGTGAAAPEGGNAPTPAATPERPEWLPEKFNSGEDLAKAYAELSKKLGSQSREPAPVAPEGSALAAAPTTEEGARQAVQNAGLDFDAVTAEFSSNGELSDATYENLAKGGIPREVVDSYIAGQSALANEAASQIFSQVGGRETYDKMAHWAADNWDDARVEQFDAILESGNEFAIESAVKQLAAAYEASVGNEPNLIGGENIPGATLGFRSHAEQLEAMRDPRYKTDPAYREDIARRLAATTAY